MVSTYLAEDILWVIHSFNIFGFLSQVYENQVRRSTAGFSFWSLWLWHVSAQALIMYAYFLVLPLPMRVMIPLEAICVALLVVQESWFAVTSEFRRRVTLWHGLVMCGSSIFWYIGLYAPEFVGMMMGWVCFLALSSSQLPQVVRNWRRKSVVGFSLPFLMFSTISSIVYTWSCYVLGLPVPSWANAVRALALRAFLWWQVVTYWRNS